MRTIITTPDDNRHPEEYVRQVADELERGASGGAYNVSHHWHTTDDAAALLPDVLVLATVDTGRYDWHAVGRTTEEADHALLLAYALHVGQVPDAEPDLMAAMVTGGEVNYVKLRPGEAARDGSPLTMPPCQDVSQAGRPRVVADALTGRPADSQTLPEHGTCSVCGEPWTAYGPDRMHDTDPGDYDHHDVRPVAQGDRLLTWDECEAAKVDPTRGHPAGRQWLASDVAAVWDRVQAERRAHAADDNALLDRSADAPEYDWTDEAPCIAAGRHRPTQRHARHECTIDPEPATDDESR